MYLVRNNARPPIICTYLEIQEKNAEAQGTGVDASSIFAIEKTRWWCQSIFVLVLAFRVCMESKEE